MCDLPGVHTLQRMSCTGVDGPRRAGNLATALSVMSWNAGGLSAQQWHELQEWAVACPYHALYRRHTGLSGRAADMLLPVAIHLQRTPPQRDLLESWSCYI